MGKTLIRNRTNHPAIDRSSVSFPLPMMPIPNLDETCQKLLAWSAPLLTEKEQRDTQAEVDRFLEPSGGGETLQHDLIKWQNEDGIANWSSPVWQDLYLESRAPLPINSNVFYYLKSKLDENTNSQAHIAASLIATVYQFMSMVDSKSLSTDMQKDAPLCMAQYDNIFSSIRIPRKGTDEFRVSASRQHIVVMHNGGMFKVQMLDDAGKTKSPIALEAELNLIIDAGEQGPNIGLFTTLQRDVWAQKRIELLSISRSNQRAMEVIEQAAFAVCLDQEHPVEIQDISQQLLHGNGTDRYFDKSLQFVVFGNGKTGINFEHTGVDGSVMLRLVAHIYDHIDQAFAHHLTHENQASVQLSGGPAPVLFELNAPLANTLENAESQFFQHISNTQTRVLGFSSFGKEQIKTFRVSPDAFVQVALQLAEHKLYGQCYSAYEAVMTRTFQEGRIDVLYTVSPESLAFIENMRSENGDIATKQQSLIRATQKHTQRANECRTGQGVYSHFLALKYRYKQAGKQLGLAALPGLFNHDGYLALTNSVVCTSTTSEYGVELAGYGPIVDNGYGIRYFIRNDSICFNMTARTGIQANLEAMHFYIEQSLLEMAELMNAE